MAPMSAHKIFPKGVKIKRTRLTPFEVLRKNGIAYRCKCDCGKETVVTAVALVAGKQVSCGCYASERKSKLRRRHGLSKRAEYSAAYSAFERCYNKHHKSYKNYGGRGIKCEFANLDEMVVWLVNHLPKPTAPLYTLLDRIDNNGNYAIGNLRWSTVDESLRNRRNTRLITIRGVTKPLLQWAAENGLTSSGLHYRIMKKVPEDLILYKGEVTALTLAQYEYGQIKTN